MRIGICTTVFVGLFGWAQQASAGLLVVNATNVGPIPDAPDAGPKNYGGPRDVFFDLSSVTDRGNVEGAQITIEMNHSFVGDLRVTLIAPDRRYHTLFENTGSQTAAAAGSPSNLVETNPVTFRDSAVHNWWDVALVGEGNIAEGFYRTVISGGDGVPNPPPVTSLDALFRTANPTGVWTLRFEDGWDGDVGEVVGATLALTVSDQTKVVSTTANAGAGSLREAMSLATDGDLIVFESPLFDTEQQILLQTRLPDIADGVTINGPGAKLLNITRDAAEDFGIFRVPADHTATISDVNISNGSEPSAFGGGVANYGTLFLIDSMVVFNHANDGGGVANVDPAARLTMIGCSLFLNTATFGGGGLHSYDGAMIRIAHSTIAENTAASGGITHGIFHNSSGMMELSDSTVVDNVATDSGSAAGLTIFTLGTGAESTTLISNTLFNNPGTNVTATAYDGANPPVVVSGGFNLATDHGSGLLDQSTDRLHAVAATLPFNDFGGKTGLVAIGPNSDAIDAGNAAGFSRYDQRGPGYDRVLDMSLIANAPGSDGSDIGAFEVQNDPDVILRSDFNSF